MLWAETYLVDGKYTENKGISDGYVTLLIPQETKRLNPKVKGVNQRPPDEAADPGRDWSIIERG